ncbi:MAG: formylglycine-generating enzyme family protein [Pyrinomonadaceae bacterium]|nr:formylglycine-generating enzyme family protein [Pyrinomonadaceae bacterium]
MRRNHKAWPALVIPLMILCFGCMLLALGQGGTGRDPTNANSRKHPSTPKPPTRKARKPNASPTPVDEAAANERTYWETIRLSSDPEDFKAYLKKYPNGQFATLAANSLRRLESQPKPPDKTNTNSAPPKSASSRPAPKAGSIVRNQLGMDLVYVPAGSFMMGSTNGSYDEKPVRQVKIKAGFYMGRFEVTQAEWQKVMGANYSHFKGDRLPVEKVSWNDAQSFISKLNARGEMQFRYRLPTEAEWEYACRAGTTGDYAGDVNRMAWFSQNSESKTHDVGGKRPNAWGLADMHGNVWEWCDDFYHESYEGAPTDGSAWVTGGLMRDRMLRGGSWDFAANVLRSAFRKGATPTLRRNYIGFRVVADPPILVELAWQRPRGVR